MERRGINKVAKDVTGKAETAFKRSEKTKI